MKPTSFLQDENFALGAAPRKALQTKAQRKPRPDVNSREAHSVQTHPACNDAGPSTPQLKIEQNGNVIGIAVNHPDQAAGHLALSQAMGTSDQAFYDGLLKQLVSASAPGPVPDEGALNFMVGVIKGVQPRDQMETMLAAQMAAVHTATMMFAQRLSTAQNSLQEDVAERAFNKLARTFAVQIEALKRYRTGGEQKVTVQHVTVNDGGQAIVGAVNAGDEG